MTDAIRDVQLHDPRTLYRHWEDSQWNPLEIELGADRAFALEGLTRRLKIIGVSLETL